MRFLFICFNVMKILPFPVSQVPWTSSDWSKAWGAQKPGNRPWKMSSRKELYLLVSCGPEHCPMISVVPSRAGQACV